MCREPDGSLDRDEVVDRAHGEEPDQEQVVAFASTAPLRFAKAAQDDEEERRSDAREQHPKEGIPRSEAEHGDDRQQKHGGQRGERDVPTVALGVGARERVAPRWTRSSLDGVEAGPVVRPRGARAEIQAPTQPGVREMDVVVVRRGAEQSIAGRQRVDRGTEHEDREGKSPSALPKRHRRSIPGRRWKPKFAHLDGAKPAL